MFLKKEDMASEYVLTEASLKKAKEENVYWQVVARASNNKINKYKLRSAFARWKKPETKHDLFVPSLRILGTEEEITVWMKKYGYTQDQIDGALDEAFGFENTDDPEFKELTAVTRQKHTVISSQQALLSLREFNKSAKSIADHPVKLINAMNEEKTSPKKRVVKKTVKPDEDKNVIIPSVLKKKMEQRLKQLKEGQVLDVSEMDTSGNGAKAIQRPAANDRVRHGIADLPIISSVEEPFEHLLKILGHLDRLGEWAETRAIAHARTPPRLPPIVKSL
jgi:hypothetical protein